MPTPIWRGASALVDQPGSPEWTFSENVSMTRTLRGPYALCLASAPGRGAIGTGIAAGLRVTESKVIRERGAIGLLTISFGVIPGVPFENIPLPADTEELTQAQQEFAVEYHPLFAGLGNRIFQNIRTLVETAPTSDAAEEAFTELSQLTGETKATAENLYRKLQKGITHFALFPPVYTRTSYSWQPPAVVNGGGIIETPFPFQITLPTGYQWLRKGDSVNWNGTHFVTTATWQGGKFFEQDLYPT